MRLPSRITLPFGYVVSIRQVTDTDMLAEMDEDEKDDLVDGLWSVDTRTIFIRKVLPLRRRRYILGHEMIHAFADWQHECLDQGAMRP